MPTTGAVAWGRTSAGRAVATFKNASLLRLRADDMVRRVTLFPKFLFWLAIVAAGAAVMVTEILGARVVGPVFGVGLFVWSALISVTLGALAVGYAVGGVLADRYPQPRLMYAVIGAAGIAISLVPPLSAGVLGLAMPMGLKLGPVVSAKLLFGLPLTLLGMVGPIAIRLRCSNVADTGRTVGRVYAASTVSGVLAALLTGLVLIPSLDVSLIWVSTAAGLLVVAALGVLSVGANKAMGALPVVSVLGFFTCKPETSADLRVIESVESTYSRVAVVEDSSRGAVLRLMRAGHSVIGAEWAASEEPAFAFLHLLEAIKVARPQGKKLLLLGLGVGSLPVALARFGVQTDVVEIDSEVVRLASKHFRFKQTGGIFVEDARTFVRRSGTSYDFIVHDTFTGGDNPEHLLSLEMLQELRARLVPGGLLAVNLVGSDTGELSGVARAFNNTIRRAFTHVRVFRDGPKKADSLSNLLFFASAAPITFGEIETFDFESEQCEQLLRQLEGWETLQATDPESPILTDSRNPVGRLSIGVSQRFHEEMNKMYPPALWLN